MKTIAIGTLFVAVLCSNLGLAQGGTEQTVVLMFDGKSCDAYLGPVESVLRKVAGVKAVDFKSMKGHAIVTIEGNKTRSNQLVQAVNGVKGEGWHCTAEVMRLR